MQANKKLEVNLVEAAATGDIETVRRLLDSGVSPDALGWSVSARNAAAENEECREFLDTDARPDEFGLGMHALATAAQYGQVEVCRALISAGARIDLVNLRANLPFTPLMLAAMDGRLDVVKFLVESGADCLFKDEWGRSAVTIAASRGQTEVCSFLQKFLDSGAMPLSLVDAVLNRCHKRVGKLLNSGTSPDEIDVNGLSALSYACAYADEAMVEVLLKTGANPDLGSDYNGATDTRLIECKRKLVDLIEPPSSKSTYCVFAKDLKLLLGEAPVLVACLGGRKETVQKLLAAGADINCRGSIGKVTPLMVSIKHRRLDFVEFVVGVGADLGARDAANGSALDWALKEKAMSLGTDQSYAIANMLKDKLGYKKTEVDYRKRFKELKECSETKSFTDVVDKLAAICESKPYPWAKRKGVFRFYVKNWDSLAIKYGKPPDYVKKAPKQDRQERKCEIASLLQDEIRSTGFLLVSHEDEQGSAMQLLFPSDDKFICIAACKTDGVNYGLNTDDIIERLREIDEEHPFELTSCMHNAVGGKFKVPVDDAKELARTLFDFCKDIVDGELIADTDDLAKEIERTRSFYLWWS